MFIYTSDSAAITDCTHCAYHITRTKEETHLKDKWLWINFYAFRINKCVKKPENLANLQLNFKINTLKFRPYSLQLSSQ